MVGKDQFASIALVPRPPIRATNLTDLLVGLPGGSRSRMTPYDVLRDDSRD